MSDILVHPNQLQSTASNLRTSASTIMNSFQRVDLNLNNLSAQIFEGISANVLQARYQTKRESLLNLYNQVLYFADQLEKIATVFENADRELQNNVKSNSTGSTPNNFNWLPFIEAIFPLGILPFLSILSNLFPNGITNLSTPLPGNQTGPGSSTTTTVINGPVTTDTVVQPPADFKFINQIDAMVPFGITQHNADCGPSSLIMALSALGIIVPGKEPGDQIVDAREHMAVSTSNDGINNSDGKLDLLEHQGAAHDIGVADITKGATYYGANAKVLAQPTPENIIYALQQGKTLVVSGIYTPELWKNEYPFTGGHFIAITSYDQAKKEFIIADPMTSGPIPITAQQLASFMSSDANAVALSNK